MSMKDKRVKSVVESDEDNEQGACGVSSAPRRFTLTVPEPTSENLLEDRVDNLSMEVPEPRPGSLLDESVDNLSMEVHLGGDNHPSEISSISYQNLLEDGEPSNSIISRRGSDDSLDSYPPDFPDAELPPDDLESFGASDLPLSEHFPMGTIQGTESREKSRGDRSSYVSDSTSNISHPNVRLKDQPISYTLENVKIREKNTCEPIVDTDDTNAKRSSLEIRSNIPIVGEVKDYEKELNIDYSRIQGHKSAVMGLKQSPGLARRVDIDTSVEKDSSGNENIGQQCEITMPSNSAQRQSNKQRPKKNSSKPKENVIEVITPIPRNINVENEYDYVKYARVQQGNSYVGMRLAYSSSSDSLNIKQGVCSENSSREPSPEKNSHHKIISNHGSQEKVCEETLMEIPLNNSDYPEDKKAFTLSPENTECDSVEVESVTSEGENSTPGFPTLEDGLSSSQASDIDEGASGVGNDHSPSKLLKSKQKAAIEHDVLNREEDCRPKEMDAQAIMNDLKMKREALDMAIADIKSAIQRSKSVSLESYSSQSEPEGTHPVWVKRINKETANQTQQSKEDMRKVQEEIERQQEELVPSQRQSHQEKVTETHEDEDDIIPTGQQYDSGDTGWQNIKPETQECTDVNCVSSVISQDKLVLEEIIGEAHPDSYNTVFQGRMITDSVKKVQHQMMNADCVHLNDHQSHIDGECRISNNFQHHNHQINSSEIPELLSGYLSIFGTEKEINVHCDTEVHQHKMLEFSHNLEQGENYELPLAKTADTIENISCEKDEGENMFQSDICRDYSTSHEKSTFLNSALHTNVILSFGSRDLENTKIDNKYRQIEESAVKPQNSMLTFQELHSMHNFDRLVQERESIETSSCYKEMEQSSAEVIFNMSDIGIQSINDANTIIKDETNAFKSECTEYVDDSDSSGDHERAEEVAVKEMSEENCDTIGDDSHKERVRPDGLTRGYDSDDEREDAEGICYTRRIKGKKYAPLQKDDSSEMGGASADSGINLAKSNGQMLFSKHGSYSGSNGSLSNHKQLLQLQSGEYHIHNSDLPVSSEESSDIDANGNSYTRPPNADSDTDEETDRLLQKQYQERDKNVEIPELSDPAAAGRRSEAEQRHSKAKEAAIRDPDRPEVLIEGVLFRARYLGSTQLISEGQPSKAMRMMQAQEAVGRIKAPEGENQPSTDVDLFVSTEKIMVLNTDLQEIMMDHSLRTISYIADIGDILVIMARRRLITSPDDMLGRRRRQAKILCHVFESDEAQLIAQSIGQAFQVAYLEFLKANGIEDPGLLKEMDYQDVLNQQEIYGEELNLFANKDFHKEVIVPKSKNEPLGVVIVESGWGSMVPTVVLANMLPTGPAARCGQLNIGDQIISINGISLVGLPLSACQTYIKASRSQTVVKLTVVPCPPVVEVLIKRPDVKYQLGFSVQNGVICSLLRGGIAERGGVRVGHRIIEINNQSVVAVPHEKIVTLLASSVGEIHMKTMPTSIFRLLTGQDVPHYL